MIRSNVAKLADAIFAKFEIRTKRKEKEPFIKCVKESFQEIGYTDAEMMMQKSRLGGSNLVVGKPDAEIIFTAHYDTPMRNGKMAMPFSSVVGKIPATLLGTVIIGILIAISYAPGIVVNALDMDVDEALIFHIIGLVLSLLIIAYLFINLFFIKNPHNHNDNTSGCLGVYNVATIVSKNSELREKCAFVLFDREEVGLLGSSAFAKWRKKLYPGKENSLVINLDCIAVGDVLVVASRKKDIAVEEREKLAGFLQEEGFDTAQKNSQMYGYLSDHANFPKGVMLAFLKRSKLGPLYIPNIHTAKDKVCDLEQIEKLSEALVKYITV